MNKYLMNLPFDKRLLSNSKWQQVKLLKGLAVKLGLARPNFLVLSGMKVKLGPVGFYGFPSIQLTQCTNPGRNLNKNWVSPDHI